MLKEKLLEIARKSRPNEAEVLEKYFDRSEADKKRLDVALLDAGVLTE